MGRNSNKTLTALLVVLAAAFISTAAQAETQLLSFDDGQADGFVSDVDTMSIECVSFFIPHPARLLKIKVMAGLAGRVKVLAWGDAGAVNPDAENPLTEPAYFEPGEADLQNWYEVDLTANPVELPPLRYVHVGTQKLYQGGALGVDTSTAGQTHSYLFPNDEPGVKYSIGDGNYMVRIEVEYHDQVTEPTFSDATAAAGLAASSRPAWGDYDGDGYDDLLLSASLLYRNNGDGTFTNVSATAGISSVAGSGVWGDYDNDGHLDYYAFSGGVNPGDRDRLVHNNGDGTFTPLDADQGLPFDLLPTEAAAWADYNRDGWLDLYVANYEQSGETLGVGTPDSLWKNLGNGQFEDVSESAGTSVPTAMCGRGVAWGDFDNDGWIDLYVANYRLDPNFLFHNNGDGTFTNVAAERGVEGDGKWETWGHSIGASWADVNGDGYLDLFVGNLAHPRYIEVSDQSNLYVNSGPPDFTFTDIRAAAGIDYCETHSDPTFWDYDNDGRLDLFLTAVYPEFRSFLYNGTPDGTFLDRSYESGLYVFNGWGASTSDFDRDGDLDLMTQAFFKNNLANDLHWIELKLVGTVSNRDAIGSRVVVKTGEILQTRQVEGGKGTGVESSFTLHFGLGENLQADEIRVRWPMGGVSVFRNEPADQIKTVLETDGNSCTAEPDSCLDGVTVLSCVEGIWNLAQCPPMNTCEEGACVPIPIDGDEEEETSEIAEEEFEAEMEMEEEAPESLEDGDEEFAPEADPDPESVIETEPEEEEVLEDGADGDDDPEIEADVEALVQDDSEGCSGCRSVDRTEFGGWALMIGLFFLLRRRDSLVKPTSRIG